MQLKSIRILIIIPALLLSASIAPHGHTLAASNNPNASNSPHPVLVELFTSEGCSSCPPADALLRQINGRQTDTGQLIVGISEHVTYWNNLGWRDPFSAEEYTDRQNAYGQRFHLDSVYTPQMVVNGEREVLGSDRNAVLRAVRDATHDTRLAVHIVSATLSGDTVSATYSVSGSEANKDAELFAVLAEDAASSNVLRGENTGRTLTHVAVARSITRLGHLKDTATAAVRLPLGDKGHASTLHLILFAQSARLGPVLSVDTLAVR